MNNRNRKKAERFSRLVKANVTPDIALNVLNFSEAPALIDVLIKKGLITKEELDKAVDEFEEKYVQDAENTARPLK